MPMVYVDLDGDGEFDYAVPESTAVFYAKNLLPSLLLNLTVQVVFSGIFAAVEGIRYNLAMYHCLVTATTVGYGDVGSATASDGTHAKAQTPE